MRKIKFVSVLLISIFILTFSIEAGNKKGSKRVGGVNSKGKGSKYIGGYKTPRKK